MSEQDRRIAEAIEHEQGRLRNFIRKRVPDRLDVEDVLQDVFFELVEAYRLMKPIEEVGAWLFRVARNRIIDRFRKKRPESSTMTRPIPDTATWSSPADRRVQFRLTAFFSAPETGRS